MFYEEIMVKQCLSYISFCPFRILYYSKFVLMEMSLGTNVVVLTRVHCSVDPDGRAGSSKSALLAKVSVFV